MSHAESEPKQLSSASRPEPSSASPDGAKPPLIADLPNWAIGGLMAVVAIFLATVIYAFAADGLRSPERIQIIYQVGLVLAGLIGLPITIWRSLTAHRQVKAALGQLQSTQEQLKRTDRQLEATRRQIAATEENNLANLLQQGAALLGEEGDARKAAGIAALR